MKKTLIAVAALAATGAFAQVTVYGRLDAGYALTTNTVNGVDTKANGVQSHNSVSSMWGIQGSEDLGGGLKANFKLEQDLYTANGNTGNSGAGGGVANSSGFNRTSLVGVSGAFGTVNFGRDYNPVFKVIGATDINGLSRVSTVQLAANTGGSTQPNLVFYSSPVLSGFQVNVAYGNSDTTNSTNTGDTTTKVMDITGTYTNGPLYVAIGTGSTEGRAAGANATTFNVFGAGTGAGFGTTAGDKMAGNVVAGSYDFKVVKLVGNYVTAKTTGAAGVTYEATELNVGVTAPLGKVLLKGQVGTNKLKVSSQAEDYTGNDYVLGADYALSAKTALFVTTGVYGKLSGNGYDQKSTSSAIGVKTVF